MFIKDSWNNAAVLKWSVNKIRVVRSPLASEALTMEAAIGDSIYTKEVFICLHRSWFMRPNENVLPHLPSPYSLAPRPLRPWNTNRYTVS